MRVVCTRIPTPVRGLRPGASPWVDLDHEYIVLGVLAEPGGAVQLHLLLDRDGNLAWFDSDCFLTVEGSVPPSWTTRIGAGGALELAPTTWHAEGFWELYYDGDPDARDSVRREVARARGNVLP
jgi:hypothetical protein